MSRPPDCLFKSKRVEFREATDRPITVAGPLSLHRVHLSHVLFFPTVRESVPPRRVRSEDVLLFLPQVGGLIPCRPARGHGDSRGLVCGLQSCSRAIFFTMTVLGADVPSISKLTRPAITFYLVLLCAWAISWLSFNPPGLLRWLSLLTKLFSPPPFSNW